MYAHGVVFTIRKRISVKQKFSGDRAYLYLVSTDNPGIINLN